MARPRRVVTQEERRALLIRRSELATLTQLPSWLVFGSVIEQEIENIKKAMTAKMLGPGVSLEEQAFNRGRIIGLRAARSVPEHALSKQLTESSPMSEEVAAGE